MPRPLNPFRVAVLVPLAATTAFTSRAWHSLIPLVQFVISEALIFCSQLNTPFVALFIFRYLRLIIHIFSFWLLYKPAPIPDAPKYHREDCTIILPTIDPENPDFDECILSCLINGPASIIIVTVGGERVAACNRVLRQYAIGFPRTRIEILDCPIANKRQQVAFAIPHVATKIIVLLDDHVFWPSANFLPTILAPFEDEKVGGVGTNKRVRRTDLGFNIRSFWNMLGAIYLERHNFEIRATNAIDGGVFVISGRTAAYRTRILQDPAFIHGFTNEMFFFGKFGPLNADDDNFITRWLVKRYWNIKIQYCDDALIETTLGTYPKFLSQCLRWARTTWRSNPASLFTDGTVWRTQIWCVYAVYLTSFVNFALFYDAALIYTFWQTPHTTLYDVKWLIAWIVVTKMVKVIGYFLRNPKDLLMLPGYFLFAYFHSFVKLYAGLTFFNTNWGGRNLNKINSGDSDSQSSYNGDDDDDNNGGYDPGYDGENDESSLGNNLNTPGRPDSSSSAHWGSGSESSSGGHSEPPHTTIADESYNRASHDNKIKTLRGPTGMLHNTPWGYVSTNYCHADPANVLESQFNEPTKPRIYPVTQLSLSPSSDILLGESLTPFPVSPVFDAMTGFSSSSPRNSPAAETTLLSPPTSPSVMAAAITPSSPQISMATMLTPPPSPPRKIPAKRQNTGSPYQRSWIRGSTCKQLHYERKKLSRYGRTCEVADVFGLPDSVVHGRPRF